MQNRLSFIPLSGIGDVTRNMYLYEYQNQILIVDCGLGFADETMLGVELLIPDITYILKNCFPLESAPKKIVGMMLTHGHEDHIGALPFLLPQLPPDFPIYATPLTAALINQKLVEFGSGKKVQTVSLDDNKSINAGPFNVSFIRVTHSVPDSAHLFIETPAGNFYHGSDFKFDLTPADNKGTDFQKIAHLSSKGVTCLLSDSLGSERKGFTPSEEKLSESFEDAMRDCKGKFIVTTYSSNISRLNQAIEVAEKYHRKVCFVGRSLINATDAAKGLHLMTIKKGMEIRIDQVKHTKSNELMLIVAGSQGQENSALTRIANGAHKDVKLFSDDTVIFSADPIPGNEVTVNSLIDLIARVGAKVIYSDLSDEYHVSGHGSADDLMLLISLVKPVKVLPISGTFRQMVAYRELAKKMRYDVKDILLVENGMEIIFQENQSFFGPRFPVKKVYVDEISGEEIESFVLQDRARISLEGIVIIVTEIDSATGTLVDSPEIVARGFSENDVQALRKIVTDELRRVLSKNTGTMRNWTYIRKLIGDSAEKRINQQLRKQPLIIPVVIEV